MPDTSIIEMRRIQKGMALIRIVTGLLMAYHGLEMFYPQKMAPYKTWDSINNLPFSEIMLYAGKAGELIAGFLLAIGLFTRYAALILSIIMLFICFYIGNGKFWYQDQHPFLFTLLALVFVVFGPGAWALDKSQKISN